MQNVATHNVNSLAPPDRQALEHLLGQRFVGNESVFLMTYIPETAPDDATRSAARRDIDEILTQVEKDRREAGVSDEEADAALDEAMRHIRPRNM